MRKATLQQAQTEGLTLVAAEGKTGYFGVYLKHGRPKPFQAQVKHGGQSVSLGSFATAEEAALCFARTPEGRSAARAAEVAAAVPPLTSEEAVQRLQARTLLCLRVQQLLKRSGLASQAALCAELNKMAQPEADAITKSALNNWLSGSKSNGRAVTEQLDASCEAWAAAQEVKEAAAGGAEAMQAARAAKEAEKAQVAAAAKAEKAQLAAAAKAEKAQLAASAKAAKETGGEELARRNKLQNGLSHNRQGKGLYLFGPVLELMRSPAWQLRIKAALAAQPAVQPAAQLAVPLPVLLQQLVQASVRVHEPTPLPLDSPLAPAHARSQVIAASIV